MKISDWCLFNDSEDYRDVELVVEDPKTGHWRFVMSLDVPANTLLRPDRIEWAKNADDDWHERDSVPVSVMYAMLFYREAGERLLRGKKPAGSTHAPLTSLVELTKALELVVRDIVDEQMPLWMKVVDRRIDACNEQVDLLTGGVDSMNTRIERVEGNTHADINEVVKEVCRSDYLHDQIADMINKLDLRVVAR